MKTVHCYRNHTDCRGNFCQVALSALQNSFGCSLQVARSRYDSMVIDGNPMLEQMSRKPKPSAGYDRTLQETLDQWSRQDSLLNW